MSKPNDYKEVWGRVDRMQSALGWTPSPAASILWPREVTASFVNPIRGSRCSLIPFQDWEALDWFTWPIVEVTVAQEVPFVPLHEDCSDSQGQRRSRLSLSSGLSPLIVPNVPATWCTQLDLFGLEIMSASPPCLQDSWVSLELTVPSFTVVCLGLGELGGRGYTALKSFCSLHSPTNQTAKLLDRKTKRKHLDHDPALFLFFLLRLPQQEGLWVIDRDYPQFP